MIQHFPWAEYENLWSTKLKRGSTYDLNENEQVPSSIDNKEIIHLRVSATERSGLSLTICISFCAWRLGFWDLGFPVWYSSPFEYSNKPAIVSCCYESCQTLLICMINAFFSFAFLSILQVLYPSPMFCKLYIGHQNLLEELLKQIPGPYLQRFWFSRSDVGPENLHFYKLSGDTDTACPWTSLIVALL